MIKRLLVSAETSAALDAEAQSEWGFNVFSLVEAAGRSCAQVFAGAFPRFFGKDRPSRITVAAGSGNNGADAMIMLRYWILSGLADSSASALVVSRMSKGGENYPRAEILKSLKKMKIPILVWDGDVGEAAGRASDDILAHSDLIVDGISGTGLRNVLKGAPLEMVKAINAHKNNPSRNTPFRKQPFVVSVDMPSGNWDGWEPEMPIVKADVTLAIEPRKYCIYTPAARPYGGQILPVGGIFPPAIAAGYKGVELLEWESVRERISKIRPEVHKNERGTVEIRAGSPGSTGAAMIAARGAQAAGAGLIRLVVDADIYPILASHMGGIMVAPATENENASLAPLGSRFQPDAVLLGPGWGIKPGRELILEKAMALEKKGTPLVLDADAIELARDKVFSGNTILTPHPGEFSRYTGLGREELLRRPCPVLQQYAHERKAVILFKGHVITIAAPDGRVGVVDGMTPGLAAGGSGDLLAGFCAAIAARMAKEGRRFDAYTSAAAASALLVASAKTGELTSRFIDPLEAADKAADLAGAAWLCGDFAHG
jgi:NAD(P)H-hydrate epimerase